MATTRGATGTPRLGNARSSEGFGDPNILSNCSRQASWRQGRANGSLALTYVQGGHHHGHILVRSTGQAIGTVGTSRRDHRQRGSRSHAPTGARPWCGRCRRSLDRAHADGRTAGLRRRIPMPCQRRSLSVCPGGSGLCCPPGEQCFETAPGTFICQVPLGGVCGNQGFGQCNGNTSRCNQPGGNPAQNPSICGGPGTVCSDGSLCVPTSPCSGARCGGVGAPCTSDANAHLRPAICPRPYAALNGTCQVTPAGLSHLVAMPSRRHKHLHRRQLLRRRLNRRATSTPPATRPPATPTP